MKKINITMVMKCGGMFLALFISLHYLLELMSEPDGMLNMIGTMGLFLWASLTWNWIIFMLKLYVKSKKKKKR